MNRSLTIVLAASLLTVSGSAFAACEGRGGLICGSGTPRVSSDADLTVSRGGSFSPLASGTGLRSGDRVLAGDAGATLALGPSCTRSVGPGALVSFTRSGGRTCASVTEPAGVAQPVGGELAGAVGVPPVALGVAAGAAVAVGLGIGLSGNDRNPTVPPIVSAQ